jgi:hypothetical protein
MQLAEQVVPIMEGPMVQMQLQAEAMAVAVVLEEMVLGEAGEVLAALEL